MNSGSEVLEGRIDSRVDVIESTIVEEWAKVRATLLRDMNTALHAQTRLIIFALLVQTLVYIGGVVAVAHCL